MEEISDITGKFLEVRVWKDGSRFVTGPELRPTSLWQPLGADSAHAPHCHSSAARLTMPRTLSGTPAIFQEAKQELMNRFISHFALESIIENLGQIDGLAAIRRGSKCDGVWVVVGFHPVVYRELRRAIVRFQASREMQECYEWAFSGYELRGKTTCRPTGPSSTRRASRPRTPNIRNNSDEFGGTRGIRKKTPSNLEELPRIPKNLRTGFHF